MPLDVTAVKLGVDLCMEDKRLKLEGLCCKNDDFFELVEVTLEAADAARLGLLFSDEATEAAVFKGIYNRLHLIRGFDG